MGGSRGFLIGLNARTAFSKAAATVGTNARITSGESDDKER